MPDITPSRANGNRPLRRFYVECEALAGCYVPVFEPVDGPVLIRRLEVSMGYMWIQPLGAMLPIPCLLQPGP